MKQPLFRLVLFVSLAVPAGCASRAQLTTAPQFYDVVILNGRVMDPESGFHALANIGVKNGTIKSITQHPLEGRAKIDAQGLVVSPGFIDTDGFPENAQLQLRDGVTTVLDLRIGTADVANWYEERERKVPVNFGVSIGFLPVRNAVMGGAGAVGRLGARPSRTQLAEITCRLRRGFEEGAIALGMGSSGEPDPTGWEHVEAFQVAAEVGSYVIATLRDDIWAESNIPANLSQMIGAAALSGVSVHVPHLTSSAGPHTPYLLQMIDQARAQGIDITAEHYPYRPAVIDIRAGELERMSDSELRQIQPMDADERLSRESLAPYRNKEFTAIVHYDSIEPFVVEAIKNPHVSFASHGSSGDWTSRARGHPRTSGTFSRVLGRYVREQRVLSLMEAIRKMALMPARRLEERVPSMRRKGRIRIGADADIVVFDAERIIDRATFKEPTRPSEGVQYVLVNGVIVVEDGVVKNGVFPGQPVRAPILDKSHTRWRGYKSPPAGRTLNRRARFGTTPACLGAPFFPKERVGDHSVRRWAVRRSNPSSTVSRR